MTQLTCVQCERACFKIRTGVYLVQHFDSPPRPYKVWEADLWKCQQCGQQTVVNRRPLMEHGERGFSEWFGLLLETKYMIINQYEE